MQKEKIICCVTNDLSYDQRMIRICNSLSALGYEVLLCGRQLPNSIPLEKKLFSQHRITCHFNKGKFFYIEYNIRLFFFLLNQKFDSVNAVDLDTALATLIASKIKRKKLVYDAHELFTEVPEVINRPFTKAVWLFVEKLFIPKTDLAYTVSDSIAAFFNKKYGKSFEVIRNVPLLKPFENTQKENAIIYQGALNEGRGLEFLIDAMHKIDAQLWIAGDGDLTAKLKEQTKQNNLENKILFLGKLSANELAQKTQKALIGFNVLEQKGLSYYYSLSNKTFDYIHAEIPQIISAFPEMKQLNIQYNFALEIENISVQEISTAINRLLKDKELHNQLSNNCAKAKKVLNWQNESQKLQYFYEQLFR